MTDDDKELVKQLRASECIAYYDDEPGMVADEELLNEVADRIEALSAENERLREAFKKPDAWLITDGETYWVTGFEPHPKGHPYCEIIPLYRAALGNTK